MSTISLCMIVRNEEKNIERCLKSAAGLVDEIIVIDTGSEDRTKDICKKYEVRIFDFEWKDDFAAARNFSIEKATGDWILWLDADEELQIQDAQALKDCLQNKKEDFMPVQMLHFYGSLPASNSRSYISSAYRLFRNGVGIYFSGKIHEKLTADNIAEMIPHMTQNNFIRILHYGYMDDEMNHKNTRNMELLLKEKNERPDDAWIHYHLAVEYYHAQEYEYSYGYVNIAILLFLQKEILPPSLVYKLKYDVLTAMEKFEIVLKSIEKAIELYPDYVDLHYYKGLAEFSIGEYEQAKNTFRHCVVLGESNPEYLILAGVGSFSAFQYIARCHEMLLEEEQAKEAYCQAELLKEGKLQAEKALTENN